MADNRVLCELLTRILRFSCLILLAVGVPVHAQPDASLEPVVPAGSPFHGVHGLRFDADGDLLAVSVIGQSLFRVGAGNGEIETLVGPPEGMGDDIAIGADGTLIWTAIERGIVYAMSPGGPVRQIWAGQRGVNAVSFSPDGEQLYVSLVFYGDALYEIDVEVRQAPRLIAEGMGGLNAFDVTADGYIYGPLVFDGRVVRIDPASGEATTVSEDFQGPGALKLDGDGGAYVLDEGGLLKHVDLASGATRLVSELPFDADNLAIAADGRIFVSMPEVNAIAIVSPASGSFEYLLEPAPLTSPTGFAVDRSRSSPRLVVGDLFGGVRIVDPATGAIEHTSVELFQPAHVDVAGDSLIVVSEVFGTVQRIDAGSFGVLEAWDDLQQPHEAIALDGGRVLVAETGAGRLILLDAGERVVVVEGLDAPTALEPADEDSVYVSETGAGRVLRVGLADGRVDVVARGLDAPEGLTVDGAGRLVVVEAGAARIVAIDTAGGDPEVVAANLPIGLANGPSLYRDVEAAGEVLYFNSDIDNTIYRLVPR